MSDNNAPPPPPYGQRGQPNQGIANLRAAQLQAARAVHINAHADAQIAAQAGRLAAQQQAVVNARNEAARAAAAAPAPARPPNGPPAQQQQANNAGQMLVQMLARIENIQRSVDLTTEVLAASVRHNQTMEGSITTLTERITSLEKARDEDRKLMQETFTKIGGIQEHVDKQGGLGAKVDQILAMLESRAAAGPSQVAAPPPPEEPPIDVDMDDLPAPRVTGKGKKRAATPLFDEEDEEGDEVLPLAETTNGNGKSDKHVAKRSKGPPASNGSASKSAAPVSGSSAASGPTKKSRVVYSPPPISQSKRPIRTNDNPPPLVNNGEIADLDQNEGIPWPKPPNGVKISRRHTQLAECMACKHWIHYGCACIDLDVDMSEYTYYCPLCLHKGLDSIKPRAGTKPPSSNARCQRPSCFIKNARKLNAWDDKNEYVVDRLLGRQQMNRGDRGAEPVYKYLVLWDGYPVEECTWENGPFNEELVKAFGTKARKEGWDLRMRGEILLKEAIEVWAR